MKTKKLLSLSLAALTLCAALSACGKTVPEAPAPDSAAQAETKLQAGVLEQNSLEATSRKQWVASAAPVRDHVKYTPFPSLNTMLMELNAGRLDFLQLPLSVGSYLTAADDTLSMNASSKASQHYHMAARAEDTTLCDELSSALLGLQEDGTLDRLAADYITNAQGAPAANATEAHEGGETHVVAVTGDLPPLDYVAADGTPAGFNVALLNAIAEKTGCNFEIVQLDAAARLSALKSGKVDLVFWIGCWSNESHEPAEDGICLTAPYFEEELCFVSNSQETLDQLVPIYQEKQ